MANANAAEYASRNRLPAPSVAVRLSRSDSSASASRRLTSSLEVGSACSDPALTRFSRFASDELFEAILSADEEELGPSKDGLKEVVP